SNAPGQRHRPRSSHLLRAWLPSRWALQSILERDHRQFHRYCSFLVSFYFFWTPDLRAGAPSVRWGPSRARLSPSSPWYPPSLLPPPFLSRQKKKKKNIQDILNRPGRNG